MDLQSAPEQECRNCHSRTIKFDYKSGLFKCFNVGCGLIQSLTVITYEDENNIYEDSCQTRQEQINNKRYVYGEQNDRVCQDFLKKLDAKNEATKKEEIKGKKRDILRGSDIRDIEDRIRGEVIACKNLIQRWCDFLDDKKILFEVVEYFLELVHLDSYCTCPSVKRKAASSFCFILAKYIGSSDIDLEELASMTGVSLSDIIKEQEKLQMHQFSVKRKDDTTPLNFDMLNGKSYDSNLEWVSICHEYLQRIAFESMLSEEKHVSLEITDYSKNHKPRNDSTKTFRQQHNWYKWRDVQLELLLDVQEFEVIDLIVKNIKTINSQKKKYEKNKISASIVLVFCLLTNLPRFHCNSPMEIAAALQLSEQCILKYYHKIIFLHREEIIPKQDVWKKRLPLSVLKIF